MGYRIKAISTELVDEIENVSKVIKQTFGVDISKVQASKIVAWKNKRYNIKLDSKKLLEILGDKNE